MMPRRARLAWALAALLTATAASPLTQGPEASLARLRSMSREQRATLAATLDTFEALEPQEQEAIRALDRELAALDPGTRARYLAVLQRYDVFRQSLRADQRKALDAEADPARKLALIGVYRAERGAAEPTGPPYADALQISELSRVRLRVLARELVVWFSLDPRDDARDRAAFDRMSDPVKRRAYALGLIRKKNLSARIREEQEEFREAEAATRKEALKLLREQVKAEVPRRKGAGQSEPGSGLEKGREALEEKGRRAAIGKLDEVQVFRQLDSAPVDPANLERFEAALPSWARESMDELPPDAARRRLKVLYRLVFPVGTEIPAPKSREPSRKVRPPGPV